jgi:hypothetical protein
MVETLGFSDAPSHVSKLMTSVVPPAASVVGAAVLGGQGLEPLGGPRQPLLKGPDVALEQRDRRIGDVATTDAVRRTHRVISPNTSPGPP